MAHANYNMLRQLAELIRDDPGGREADYARVMGVDQRRVQRWLVLLEERGVYLAEDDNGGLDYVDGLDGLQSANERINHEQHERTKRTRATKQQKGHADEGGP